MTGTHLPSDPIGATFCSGIGAPEVACPEIDWRFACEIDAGARAVLQSRLGYRAPEDRHQGDPFLHDDMATIAPGLWRERGIPLPDILVAGTPCQAFSLAGKRLGTADARGNLTLRFVEICHDIVAARPDGRLLVVWENVPGVLSDKGNAFGCFLAGLVGADDALHTPGGGSWPDAGMAAGPRARAAWRVLDAQHFGCAQRRRRVFVVVGFGEGADPAAILFERQGVRGHSAARRQAREDVAEVAGDGAAIRCATGEVTHALTSGGFDASEDGTGRGTPIVSISSTGDVAHCLNAGGMGRQDYETETLIAFSACDDGGDAQQDHTPTLRAGSGQRAGGGQQMALAEKTNVRRLTERECHRLQGFSDDWCAIERRGKPVSGGPQYKQLGNSMATPVMRWILTRCIEVEWAPSPFTGNAT